MKIRTLLVDDEKMVANAILSRTRNEEIVCTVVETLADAIATLSVQSFDVVLLDLNLPDSRGMKTFEKVHEVAPGIPIVVMTGMMTPEERPALLRSGAATIINKPPLNAQEIVDAIYAAGDSVNSKSKTGADRNIDTVAPWLPVVEHFQRVVNEALKAHETRNNQALCEFAKAHEEKLDLRFRLLKSDILRHKGSEADEDAESENELDSDPKSSPLPTPSKEARRLRFYTRKEWFRIGSKALEITGVILAAYVASRWGTHQPANDAAQQNQSALASPAK